jgi:hypothetical protein
MSPPASPDSPPTRATPDPAAERTGGASARRRGLHPELAPAERRRLLLAARDLFRRGELFACHEAWETVWRSSDPEPRDLWRGLIQLAVALYHHRARRRPDVARRVLAKARRRLLPFAPVARGLDVAALLAAAEVWDRWLAGRVTGTVAPEPPLPPLDLVDPAAYR